MGHTKFVPGFRFHPTDVELAKYYLKRKVMGKRLPRDVIAEVDIYNYAPWDLPDKSSLRTGDLEWYFFCPKGTKYASGARMNRATEDGFWKTTGRDRTIEYNNQTVGMIKTLVFHIGRAPRGDRTDWVMHEYKLEEKELTDKGIPQHSYVLCKVFRKNGPGPRNGAHYGKPFNEEEWDTDEEAPGGEEPVLSAALPAPVSIVPATQYNSDAIDLHLIDHGCIGQSSVSCASGPKPAPTDEEAPDNEEPVLSAALPAPVSMGPATQYNSDVIDLHLIDHGSIGQSSVSCASGDAPKLSPSSSRCMIPDSGPSDQVITYENFGVPDDNEMAVMLDYFGEDNRLAFCGNNNTEVLDNCGCENNANGIPCFDINNFLKDLGDHDNLAGMGGDGHCSTFDQQAEDSTNQMLPTLDFDDFFKLDDLDFPLFDTELGINLIENEKDRR